MTESSAIRSLRLRLRPDLEIRDSSSTTEKVWVVRDPITLQYYRLIREEYEILRWLDGQHSLVDVQKRHDALFSPLRLEMQQLTSFLSRLYSDGLLISDDPRQAAALQIRRKKNRFQRALSVWSNPLAIRGPGISPRHYFAKVTACFGGLFTLPGFVLALCLFVTAVSLVLINWHSVNARLPQLQTFFEGQNFLLLIGVLAIVKVFHELGHAAACEKYGGHCHQIGMMFLMFVPTLFCDVSDAWLIPQRTKRIIISAAGMYVEIILAAVATIFWWYSTPGMFNAVCLNIMLVCSVSTVLMNGNPFLRYDGYYILSDLVNMPNLKQRSSNWWVRTAKSACFGIQPRSHELPATKQHSVLFCTYGFASTIFRFCLLTMILWFAYRFLADRKLTVFFFPLLFVVIAGTFGPPVKKMTQFVRDPLVRTQMRPLRVAVTILVSIIVALFCCLVPLPAYVYCPALIEPYEAQNVYAYQSGQLKSAVAENSEIESGDLIFQLVNEDLEYELEELSGELEQQKTRVKDYEARSLRSPEIQNEIPLAKKLLADLQEQYDQKLEQHSQLKGYALMDGVVFPPPIVHSTMGAEMELTTYTGSPLNRENFGCWVEAGTLLCTIGIPEKMQATLLANEQSLQLIKPDQDVSLLPASVSYGLIQGRVSAVGKSRQETVPEQFLPDERIMMVPRADGTNAPLNPLWEIRVRWSEASHLLEPGMRGTARIQVESMTLLTRFRRWLNATFQL